MLQTYISSDNQHIKKQKLISTAVLLENPAALSLEWVECKRKYVYSKECRDVSLIFIFSCATRRRPFD